uniref:Uncharacterized protein n=1 Tax=Compsopogon caeruleus TaxID=31354 RepID=A0A7S1TFS8_9RHOD|mmetsp:Transcript_5213/g.10638  ORF Transcript_5213/g.10638 Transcript_5213/m.10638 type:complete len:407 (+) Transcript_5213:672-1892(+)
MEVTRHNFREAIVTLEDALKHAKFVAIDTEFSGLARTDSVHNTPLDTPSMRYMSVREAAMEFPILQLGICVFQEPPSLDSSDSAESGPGRTRWLAHPFNFYCSPRPFYLKPGHRVPVTDRIFSMQASSVEFLARANFDFNKCFRDGIGALNGSEVSLIRAAEARMAQFPRKMVDRTTVDEKCLKYFNETTEAIKNWWNGNTVTESDRLRLPPGPTGTARRLIYEFIETEHPELQATVIGGGNCPDPPMLVVSKPSKKLRESTQESLRSRALALLDQRLENDAGMRTVLRILRQQQVPLIFHNSLADLSRLIHQFEEELPEKLNEFRCSLNLFCPKLIDTKMLVEHARITSSLFKGQVNLNDALKEILSTRKSNHEYEMSQGQERYIEAQHEPSLLVRRNPFFDHVG